MTIPYPAGPVRLPSASSGALRPRVAAAQTSESPTEEGGPCMMAAEGNPGTQSVACSSAAAVRTPAAIPVGGAVAPLAAAAREDESEDEEEVAAVVAGAGWARLLRTTDSTAGPLNHRVANGSRGPSCNSSSGSRRRPASNCRGLAASQRSLVSAARGWVRSSASAPAAGSGLNGGGALRGCS